MLAELYGSISNNNVCVSPFLNVSLKEILVCMQNDKLVITSVPIWFEWSHLQIHKSTVGCGNFYTPPLQDFYNANIIITSVKYKMHIVLL